MLGRCIDVRIKTLESQLPRSTPVLASMGLTRFCGRCRFDF